MTMKPKSCAVCGEPMASRNMTYCTPGCQQRARYPEGRKEPKRTYWVVLQGPAERPCGHYHMSRSQAMKCLRRADGMSPRRIREVNP